MKSLVLRFRWWIVALPLLVGCAGCESHSETVKGEEGGAEEAEAAVTVRVVPARFERAARTIEGLGRCEALPDHIAPLTPAVEGHVHELLVEQGREVKRGQPIVELDRAVAQADLAEKTATRDGLVASLALLKSIPRPEESRANELAVEQAKITLEQSRIAADRLRPLVKRHEVPEQQLQDAERAVHLAELQKETAEATLHAMLIGPRREAIAEAEGRIKTADALVAFSRAHLEYHTIRSPIDGVLDSLTCRPGQTIAIGSPIGEVVDTRQVFAAIWLAPGAASSVRVGQTGRVRPADAIGSLAGAEGHDREMTGKVAFVGRVADPQTGNLPIRVLVDNPEGRLTIGQSIRLSVVLGEHEPILQVPSGAVLDLGDGPVLSVVRDGKSVVLHPEVGATHDGWTEVAGTDLKPGEPVIVDGGYNLPEKTAVKVLEGEDKGKDEPKEKADEPKEGEPKEAGKKAAAKEDVEKPAAKEDGQAAAKEGARS
ncbi:MAG: efflux RND transporter periplasmic adaptor subunit [Isosphaeraceae bacterium]